MGRKQGARTPHTLSAHGLHTYLCTRTLYTVCTHNLCTHPAHTLCTHTPYTYIVHSPVQSPVRSSGWNSLSVLPRPCSVLYYLPLSHAGPMLGLNLFAKGTNEGKAFKYTEKLVVMINQHTVPKHKPCPPGLVCTSGSGCRSGDFHDIPVEETVF